MKGVDYIIYGYSYKPRYKVISNLCTTGIYYILYVVYYMLCMKQISNINLSVLQFLFCVPFFPNNSIARLIHFYFIAIQCKIKLNLHTSQYNKMTKGIRCIPRLRTWGVVSVIFLYNKKNVNLNCFFYGLVKVCLFKQFS